MCDEDSLNPVSQSHPPGSADPASESSRIHKSAFGTVTDPRVLAEASLKWLSSSALSLGPSSNGFRSSKMFAQLHLRERRRALFGQPNSPRHCCLPRSSWPASVDPCFGLDKMCADEPPKSSHSVRSGHGSVIRNTPCDKPILSLQRARMVRSR